MTAKLDRLKQYHSYEKFGVHEYWLILSQSSSEIWLFPFPALSHPIVLLKSIKSASKRKLCLGT